MLKIFIIYENSRINNVKKSITEYVVISYKIKELL